MWFDFSDFVELDFAIIVFCLSQFGEIFLQIENSSDNENFLNVLL